MISMLKLRLVYLSNFKGQSSSLSQSLFGASSHFPHGRSTSRILEILHNRVGLSSNRNTSIGFRTFCSSQDLTTKKCVSCSSVDMKPMSEEAANGLLPKVPEWNLVNEGEVWKLCRSWKVKTFARGMQFLQSVAETAETEGHHPDLHLVNWNNVTIEIWTHSVGGLTENDFILAAKINALKLDHLLRKNPV
ncbi:pterin-4-alpha-carbinolamine dehydratase 2, mitochondrial [Impatiens glandulifera]|uniref:pterin-4-alpha-carbinolamine dehydratase 2, mitochondrial n=1 Tax=Impatiens glandulifera TaxID=253017 RepID=UPI001FB115C3|nr:pterin-4-alpha-carbinolamine dehydratase 2, mitochondrial [Impatiens glandulifera]